MSFAFRSAALRSAIHRGVATVAVPPPPPPVLPTLSFVSTNVSGDEGDSGTTTFLFTVSRFGAADRDASVSWTVAGAGINPASPVDFIGATSGVLIIPAGASSGSIVVDVAGDVDVETTEQFTVTLSAPVDCVIGTAVAWGTIVNDDSPYVPPPPPAPDGSTPAWVADTSRFQDYVVRLVWDANPANGWRVAPPLAGETQCPGFAVGALVNNLQPFTNTSMLPLSRILGQIYKSVAWPKGVTVYLPSGVIKGNDTTYDSISVMVNARLVGAARAKTWMTDGLSDGTHFDYYDSIAGGYINLAGIVRFENITWRGRVGKGVKRHAIESSCIHPGCLQFVGCEFRWLADAIKLHEPQTNDKKNYPASGGYGPPNYPIWTTKGIKKDTGTSVWMYDCVVRECGGEDSGLKHGLIYALNGNTLRLDRVAVIDTTRGYLGAKVGVNALWASGCLFVNRWSAASYGYRIDPLFAGNNPARYWGDTLIESQTGTSEIVLKDSQFWHRSLQGYATLKWSGNPDAGATLAIDGYVVGFVAANPAADQVLIGADMNTTVTNFVAMMKANAHPVARAFDYEKYGSDTVILSRKGPTKTDAVVVASATPAARVVHDAGGKWSWGPQAFLYDHSRGKMPLSGGGKMPDYFTREWPGTNGSWGGMWWNNGSPTTPGDSVAKPGYMRAFVRADRVAASTSNYCACSFTGASGSWPAAIKGTITNTGWVFVRGSGALAANRGRFVGPGASGIALVGDTFASSEAVEISVTLATIPASDEGQGIVHLSNEPSATWATATKYGDGATVKNQGSIYRRRWMASAPALSGTTAPTGTGTSISDGAYLWDYVGPVAYYTLTYRRASGWLAIGKQTAASRDTLAQASVGVFTAARLKLSAVDGVLKGKIWGAGLAEPQAWAVVTTDPSPLAEGRFGLLGQNSASEYVEFDDLSADCPYVGRMIHCEATQNTPAGDWNNNQFDWPPAYEEINDALQMPTRVKAPHNATNYWRAYLTLEDAAGQQTAWETDATCDGRARCLLKDPIPAGQTVPKGSLVQLAPKTRPFHDTRLLNPAYHDPAHPDYYWNKLYRADGTLKEPGDPGFNEAFHVRYVDDCSFTFVGPPQNLNGMAPPIMKYNPSAYRFYMRSVDNEGYYALPPQWNAETSAWAKPAGAGTFTHDGATGTRFFCGTAPTGFRGHGGSDFSDPVTWMFINSSHYCLPSEFRGGIANPQTALQSYDDPSGTPANEQVPPRPRVFVQDKDTGVLTRGGARPVSTLTTLAQDGAKGDSTIRVASTAGLAVGHKIEIPLANDPWGLTQSNDPTTGRIKPYADTHVWRHVTRITAIAGDVVTLADPLPDPFPGDGLTAIAKSGAAVATTPVFPRPAHVIARFEDMTIATQVWPL